MRARGTARLLSLIALTALAAPASAATVAPPASLGELARLSRVVVLARAGESGPEGLRGGLPHTATRFARLRQVVGIPLPDAFVVSEPGGVHGDVGLAVGGSPAYEKGRTYLLFLDRTADGRLRSQMMAYGLLVEDEATGLLVPLPEAAEIEPAGPSTFEPVSAYDTSRLLDHLAEVVQGRAWDRERAGWTPAPAALVPPPGACQFLVFPNDGLPVRWFLYETTDSSQIRHTTPGQVGIGDGGVSAVTQGVAAWTNHPDSIIKYTYGGSTAAAGNCSAPEQGAVWFNDPCNAIPDLSSCSGTLAFGGAFFQVNTTTYDGDQWHRAVAPYVVVNNGSQCIGDVSFREMMTHELGHTQGFGHHAVAAPPNNPTMSAVLKADGRGAALVGADKTCASYAYHTFLDVPFNHFAWRFVEAVENAGVTSGCGAGNYCPDSSITREQMAVFLLLASQGASFNPPPCTVPPFNDVPVSSPFCKWIRELAARNVTGGCDANGNYCPTAAVTREQMAVLLLRTRFGGAYVPPPCNTQMFSDVPCSSPFARWINDLVGRGITSGCGTGVYCPTSPNTRAQMAIFLTTTFALSLPN